MQGLDEGSYVVNVSVTDGKFTTVSQAETDVVAITDAMVDEALVMQLGGASPEEFLLSYKRSFHRAVKSLFGVKPRDVVVLSIQRSKTRDTRQTKKKLISKGGFSLKPDLDVLFVVRKNSDSFYPRNLVRKKVLVSRQTLEDVLGLSVLGVLEDRCAHNTCDNGDCVERIVLSDDHATIATDTISFVSLVHSHEAQCVCPEGWDGLRCEVMVNECTRRPCPSYKVCVPQEDQGVLGMSSLLVMPGYDCECPEGLMGPTCTLNRSSCLGRSGSPECYQAVAPLSLGGRSYVQYTLRNPIERHFAFSVWFRTVRPASNLLFTAGRVDYSILELRGGEVRYRWDLGSGEGVVAVEGRLDDGGWHHVKLERFGNSAELLVDGLRQAAATSPGSSDLLNLASPTMYLGAELVSWGGEVQEPRQGFVGCLDDPRVDDSPLPLTRQLPSGAATLTRMANVDHRYT